jgi:hypothetical protein
MNRPDLANTDARTEMAPGGRVLYGDDFSGAVPC